MRAAAAILILALPAFADPGADAFHDVPVDLRTKIDWSIDSGVAFLQGAQAKSGEFPSLYVKNISQGGQHMLIVYALLASGVDPEDAGIKRALRARPASRLTDKHHINYACSVAVLAYARHVEALETKYAGRKVSGKAKSAIAASKRQIKSLATKIAKSQAKEIWRYPGSHSQTNSDPEDLSATQYVLLALRSARKHGVKIDSDVFARAVRYLLREQEADGAATPLFYRSTGKDEARYGKLRKLKQAKARGWSYKPRTLIFGRSGKNPRFTGAMTAAGVACLAICKEALLEQGALKERKPADAAVIKAIDKSLEDGWAKLGAEFTPKGNPGQGRWHYYYLYGVERVGAFLGVPNMGEHWWFKEGAEVLISQQQEDGSWEKKGGNQTQAVQTCFALLFLKRATKKPAVPIRPPVVSGK
ncbi:MAG: hypothetical protein ACYTGZ_22500 [Planctomycetota bacterium]|jgi:hypothetical protein